MAATADRVPLEPANRDGVAPPLAFDYAVLFAALWFVGGLLVDGWAHNTLDLSKEGFFTPYHALFYSGFAAVATVIGSATLRNFRTRGSLRVAIPHRYDTTVAGLAIFAVGGACDMAWHIVFGVEQDVEALLSPTHLLLATGIALILCGPIRATMVRSPQRSWGAQFPALCALGLLATLVTFFFLWAFGLAAGRAFNPHVVFPALSGAALEALHSYQIEHGIAAIVLRSLVMVGVITWAARRFDLPFGAATALVAMPSVLVGAMLAPTLPWIVLQAASALAAGLVADIALLRMRHFDAGLWRSRAVGFAIPFVFWFTYIAIASIESNGFWWSPHVVYGAPVIGGLVGLLLFVAMEPHHAA